MARPEVEILSGEPAGLPGPIEAERVMLDIDGIEHTALISFDLVADGVKRWHISLSVKSESDSFTNVVPLWRNLVAAVHKLRPGVCFVVPLPPENQWYNLNEAVLHAYELNDPALESHFKDQHDSARKLEGITKAKGITEPS